ncbi:hypothetical protein H8D91_02175 [archaeon]|nr:hypothetical protein [archaeon]
MQQKSSPNRKVVWLSVIAIICVILTYTVHWLFIIPAIVIMIKNHKELFGKKK